MQELTLPDIYMCLPATVVAKVTLKALNHNDEWKSCMKHETMMGTQRSLRIASLR